MNQAYVIAKIKQIGREISIIDTNISYQYAANLYLELELDKTDNSPFKDMLLNVIGKRKGTNHTVICPLLYEEEKVYVLLPEELLKQEGIVYISLGGINQEKVVITSNMVHLEIVESNPIITTITPVEQYWQMEVGNAITYWYETTIKPDLNDKQARLDALIEEAKTQQDTVGTQQSTLDTVIDLVKNKVANGDFIPKHKWEGDVLYFTNEDGTWDKGFKVPGVDALHWKIATCVEGATYQADIENWGTVENSLLAITFDTALDNTKEVILKINDEEAYPILSNQEPMLGEELENKSTILRFDGTSWLVQTSQSGTVQSSDKSVKDIVTVSKEELKQLQEEGLLVEGTLYQTVEGPMDVTPLEGEIIELEERTTDLEKTAMKVTDIENGDGYVKFPDGTLICQGAISVNTNINLSWGNGYTGVVKDSVAFPVEFISPPSCNITLQNGTYAAAIINTVVTATKITEITFFREEVITNTFKFNYIAIGRWK